MSLESYFLFEDEESDDYDDEDDSDEDIGDVMYATHQKQVHI